MLLFEGFVLQTFGLNLPVDNVTLVTYEYIEDIPTSFSALTL